MANPDLRMLVEAMAKAMADDTDAVSVETVEKGSDETLLELRVAERDLGKVIGKQGRTARSLRTILSAASSKGRQHYSLDIVE